MPQLTNIEEAFLDDLDHQADNLEKAEKDDVPQKTSEVVAKLAKVIVAMAKTGGVSTEECKANQVKFMEKVELMVGKSDWKAKLATWLPASVAGFGLGWKVLEVLNS